MNNPFCHIELNTTDPAKAKQFYGKLFSWQMEDADMGGGHMYTMLKTGADPGGGMQKTPMPGMPTAWISYVHVEDVDRTLAQASSLGGKVIAPKTPIPNTGFFGIIQDPTGGVFGIWEAAKK